MMQCKIYNLPSAYSYALALSVWEKAKEPRTTGQKRVWGRYPDETRPLDDFRKTHYRVSKNSKGHVTFSLYDTDVVTWLDSQQVTINSTYDSTATSQFIHRFTGFAHIVSKHNFVPSDVRCLEVGQYLHSQAYYRRGIATFHQHNGVWHPITPVERPMKPVVDPQRAAEVKKLVKPFAEWLQAIYALLPADAPTSHPWVGQRINRLHATYAEVVVERLKARDETVYPELALAFCSAYDPWPFRIVRPGTIAGGCDWRTIVRGLREYLYRHFDCYVEIPYDETIKRRK